MAAISRYRTFELNTDEAKAIDDIEAVFNAYVDGLKTVLKLINQKKTAAEIIKIVRIDDGPALKGLAQLKKALPGARDPGRTQKNMIENFSRLDSTIGYGGMIHNFMDFIFYKQPSALAAAEENILRADAAVGSYLQVTPLSQNESGALKKLQKTIEAYRQQIAKAKSSSLAGVRPEKFSDVVKINDRAIIPLRVLEHQAAARKDEAWLYVTVSIILVVIVIIFNAVSSWLNGRITKGLNRV